MAASARSWPSVACPISLSGTAVSSGTAASTAAMPGSALISDTQHIPVSVGPPTDDVVAPVAAQRSRSTPVARSWCSLTPPINLVGGRDQRTGEHRHDTPAFTPPKVSPASRSVGCMATKIRTEKIPVENVRTGDELLIPSDGGNRSFHVETSRLRTADGQEKNGGKR